MTDIRSKVVEPRTETQAIEHQQTVTGKRGKGKVHHAQDALAAKSDTVDISLGKEINNEISVDRRQRIAELKALVQSGNYKPDSKAVAASFVDFVEDEIQFEKMGQTPTPPIEES